MIFELRRVGTTAAITLTLATLAACSPATTPEGEDQTSTGLLALHPDFLVGADEDAAPTELLYKPTSVAISDQDDIFVVDAGNHRVAVFDAAGEFVSEIGRRGTGPGEFLFGGGFDDDIAVDREHITVLEKRKQRIQVFTRDGDFVSSFDVPHVPASIAISGQLVYVSMSARSPGAPNLAVFSLEGAPVSTPGIQITEGDEQLRTAKVNLEKSYVGATGDEFRQAFMYVPLVRAGVGSELTQLQWFDFTWLGDADRASRLNTAPGRDLRAAAEQSKVVFVDVEYASGPDVWLYQLNGAIVQAVDDTGRPQFAYQLEPGDDSEQYVALDIGVNQKGNLLCTADFLSSVVRCYRPEQWRPEDIGEGPR